MRGGSFSVRTKNLCSVTVSSNLRAFVCSSWDHRVNHCVKWVAYALSGCGYISVLDMCSLRLQTVFVSM